MGGGVGKVLSGISAYSELNVSDYRHSIILLDKPEKTNFIDICRVHNVDINIANKTEDVILAIRDADIVQLEWWHHPLMYRYLDKIFKIPVRLLIWSHVSGCYYPYLPMDFVKFPQKFVFTSHYSSDNPYWDKETQVWAKKFCSVVNSSGGFDAVKLVKKDKNSADFCVGYMGTQAFSKLHPEFMNFCKAISNIPQIKFYMVGDNTNEQILSEQAKKLGIAELFRFEGYVNDVSFAFSKMDVFGYLLNPKHFGTTENALLEAMAAELPVVCLRQAAEQYLIEDGKTGILVNNIEEYKNAISYLWKKPKKAKELGENAKQYVLKEFSVKKTVQNLNKIYDVLMKDDKRKFDFAKVIGNTAYEYFERFLPPDLSLDCKNMSDWPEILKGYSKSSLPHFCRVYPKDDKLNCLKNNLR